MKRLFFLIAVLLSSATSTLRAQLTRPEVDGDEVIRRGNMVEVIDGYGDETDPVGDALAPPPDDSYKWFITVVTTNGCRYCKQLERDFAESDYLKAFANVEDYKRSWSHFNVYSIDDPTQSFRFKKPSSNIALRGFPTILIQPPLNGKYGSAKTIVFQKTGYDGNPRKLAEQMSAAIKRYVATVKTPVKRDEIRAHQRRGQRSGVSGQESDSPCATGSASVSLDDALAAPDAFLSLMRGQRKPPFDLPDDSPAVDPVAPPLVIPSPVDPDAKTPDKKPEVEPEADATKSPTAYIISNETPDQVAGDKRIARVLEGPRKRLKGLVEKVLTLADAKKQLPNLAIDKSKLPAVIVTEDGKVTDQVTADTMPAPALPWQEVLSGLLAYLTTGAFPYAAIAAAGWYVFLRLRKRRADAGKPKIISDGLLGKLHNLADLLLARFTPAPPAPTPDAPASDPMAQLLALAEKLLNAQKPPAPTPPAEPTK